MHPGKHPAGGAADMPASPGRRRLRRGYQHVTPTMQAAAAAETVARLFAHPGQPA